MAITVADTSDAWLLQLSTPCARMRSSVSRTCKISSVVSVSVALAEPSASKGSSPLVMRHCRAGASPEQVHVRLSVVNTGTATVSTGMFGLYLATRRAVEPPLVRTTIKDACTCSSNDRYAMYTE